MGSSFSRPERVSLLGGYYDIDEVGLSASSAHLSRIRRQAQCGVCCYTFCNNCRMVFTWKLLLALSILAVMSLIMWLNRNALEEYFTRENQEGVPI